MRFRSISIGILCLCLLAGAASAAVEVETVNVSALRAENSPPVAQNLSLDTYRGVSVGGTFQAVDPEGDLLSFRITAQPGKGTVTVDGSHFVYTPAPGKRGRDRFTYQAVDAAGSASPDAEVSIRIGKQSTDVFYPELNGSGLQYAAQRLAEEGIFTGERIGLCYGFSQDRTLSRGDFLTMCAALTGMDTIIFASFNSLIISDTYAGFLHIISRMQYSKYPFRICDFTFSALIFIVSSFKFDAAKIQNF